MIDLNDNQAVEAAVGRFCDECWKDERFRRSVEALQRAFRKQVVYSKAFLNGIMARSLIDGIRYFLEVKFREISAEWSGDCLEPFIFDDTTAHFIRMVFTDRLPQKVKHRVFPVRDRYDQKKAEAIDLFASEVCESFRMFLHNQDQ